jgi:peroxiredoxin
VARTPSTMIELGTEAPDFVLPDAGDNNALVALQDYRQAPVLVVMFICNHCPFVKHVVDELARLGRDCKSKGIAVVAINSNDVSMYPDDSPGKMAELAKEHGFVFPYLFDETQEVAKAYGAACTPDFFIFDRSRRLFYRGQLDDSRPVKYQPEAIPVTGKDLREAINLCLLGGSAPGKQLPSLGCNIKWKPGNEPVYAAGSGGR